jgi:hypothetical protein
MNNLIIGLCGKAGSGKTTIAKELAAKYGGWRMSFASPIKAILKDYFFWDGETKDAKWRKAMQYLGTEFGRTIVDDEIWLKHMERQISLVADTTIIIDDVRFDNEAKWIKDNGGIVVNVMREESYNLEENKNHASEQGVHIDYIDLAVYNDYNVASAVDNIFSRVTEKIEWAICPEEKATKFVSDGYEYYYHLGGKPNDPEFVKRWDETLDPYSIEWVSMKDCDVMYCQTLYRRKLKGIE